MTDDFEPTTNHGETGPTGANNVRSEQSRSELSGTDFGDEEGDGGGNRNLMIAVIAALILIGVPAIFIGGMMLGRSDKSVETGDSASTSTPAPTSTEVATSDSTDDTSTATSSSAVPTTTTGNGDDEPGVDMSDADNSPKSIPMDAQDITYLEDVRVASHDGYDRVTLEFDGLVPGYEVEYIDGQLIEDGSGKPLKIKGAPMQVTMYPASGYKLDGDDSVQVYKGPDHIQGTGRAIKEVMDVGDFEARLSWGIGVEGRRPFKVMTLENPSRIVIDIKAR